ncbi:hypothetical protein [Aliarcobacter cryaerophilus]|uniref:hypothetical protein n=1 Tax=Aliarcobacter cryaerophilus TaxID=28198 RepID=UPI0021B4D4AC|nr:hypothetical protein [Aliarcobacter cryaerophilus]MCT7543412.1 hypothetical protein [Aliarcobacter cryaerophilus]
MGINIILPLIMGIAMTVIVGSQVVPSFVEQMKVAKVENRTISNQNLIKDAIVRYIKTNNKLPETLEDLKKDNLLKDYHESNLFGGGYTFKIDKKKGTLKIFTTINDEDAGKYFSNSFKFPNAPTCVKEGDTCKKGKWETFYLLDEDTFKSIPIPEVGSSEWADENYTNDNLGQKLEEGKELENGYVDYVKEGDKIIEYIYDKTKDQWVEGEENTFEENKYVAGIIAPEKLYNYWLNFQTIGFNSYGYIESTQCFSGAIEFYHYYSGNYDKLGFYALWVFRYSDLSYINNLKGTHGFNDVEIEIFRKRQLDRIDILKALFKDILSPTILDIAPNWNGSLQTTTKFKICGTYEHMLSEVVALENKIKEVLEPTCKNRSDKFGSQKPNDLKTKQQHIDFFENPDYFCPDITIKKTFVDYIDTKYPSIK